MKLTNAMAVSTATKGGKRESKPEKEARFREWFAQPVNQVLHPVGRYLGNTEGGLTYADLLMMGESLENDSITIDGFKFPLDVTKAPTLVNINPVWACPMCKSAHGSGVGVSTEVNRKGLLSNKWFYNPNTLQLFVISDTCYGDYVTALGHARFFVPASVLSWTNAMLVHEQLIASRTEAAVAAVAVAETAVAEAAEAVAAVAEAEAVAEAAELVLPTLEAAVAVTEAAEVQAEAAEVQAEAAEALAEAAVAVAEAEATQANKLFRKRGR